MISIKQIKAARLFLEWTQKDLVQKSGLSLPTIQRMETLGVGRSSMDNVQKLQEAFENAGIEFLADGQPSAGRGIGVRLRDSTEGVDSGR